MRVVLKPSTVVAWAVVAYARVREREVAVRAGVLGEIRASRGVVAVGRETNPALVDDAGERERKRRVLVDVGAYARVGIGDGREPARGVVGVLVHVRGGVGHRGQAPVGVVGERQATPVAVGRGL